MSLAVDPGVGMVAVEFLDKVEDEADENYPSASSYSAPVADDEYNKGVFAMCLGVGKTSDGKPVGYKRGDTLIIRQSERKYAVEIPGDGCLISQYSVLGKLKA